MLEVQAASSFGNEVGRWSPPAPRALANRIPSIEAFFDLGLLTSDYCHNLRNVIPADTGPPPADLALAAVFDLDLTQMRCV